MDIMKPGKEGKAEPLLHEHCENVEVSIAEKNSTQKAVWTPHEQIVESSPFGPTSFITKTYIKAVQFRLAVLFALNKPIYGRFTLIDAVIFTPAIAVMMGIAAVLVIFEDFESLGDLAVIPMITAFVFAIRNTCLFPFEQGFVYHKLMAVTATSLALVHGLCWEKEYLLGQLDDGIDDLIEDRNDRITGWALFACMALLCLASTSCIRRRCFQLFLYSHIFLFLAAIGLAIVHGAGAVMIGAGLWCADFLFRNVVRTRRVEKQSATLDILPAQVARIQFENYDGTFKYRSGQFVFVRVPSISKLQWHPFSISSSPHHDHVSLHVRVLGDWTQKLHQLVVDPDPSLVLDGTGIPIEFMIEGPYGGPALDIGGEQYQLFLLISGGIGITPMQSIANDLMEQRSRGRPIRKLVFVWSVRDRYMIDTMVSEIQTPDVSRSNLPLSFCPDLLDRHSDDCTPSADFLSTEFYLTRVRDEADFAVANINPSVQPCLRFGRPPLRQILAEMRCTAREAGQSRVAVLVCGPQAMAEDVQTLCLPVHGGVHFDVHQETFAF